MKIKIVQTNDDKKQAFYVRHQVFVKEQKVPATLEVDANDSTATHFVGYQDHEPIAAGRLRFVDDYGKLERICVLHDFRGMSYGKQMIQAMEAEIIQQGYAKAKLNAQTHAEAFYQLLGYETISDEFLDAGMPHVTMIKNV